MTGPAAFVDRYLSAVSRPDAAAFTIMCCLALSVPPDVSESAGPSAPRAVLEPFSAVPGSLFGALEGSSGPLVGL